MPDTNDDYDPARYAPGPAIEPLSFDFLMLVLDDCHQDNLRAAGLPYAYQNSSIAV